MTTTRHTGSVRIDSPVERAFDHVKEPAHFYEAMPARMQPTPGSVGPVQVTPEGIGTTHEWVAGHIAGFKLVGVITREEYVVNERIFDSSATGPVWNRTVAPEGGGTRLSLTFEYSSRVPLRDEVIDAIGWRGDSELEAMLATVKEKVET